MGDIKVAINDSLVFLHSLLNDNMVVSEMNRIARLLEVMKKNFTAELQIV
jgi:hypothetical protein